MSKIINVMSDTVTHPTEEMRKAMYEAEVGDDVSKADPTVNELQRLASETVGTEDSLFVPSGTMGNLIALMCSCSAGKSLFIEAECHINLYEGGGLARVAGLVPHLIKGKNGIIDPDDLRSAIDKKENVHKPFPGMISIENTHNIGGGTVIPIEYLKEYRKIADEFNLKIHMDGARVFNAATYLGVDVKEIVQYVDSVTFCLSKGLSAPIGSLLCGTKDFIKEALWVRKLLGGGMRQVGVIAAAGIISLTEMTQRLADDHENAKKLAVGLNEISGITVDLDSVQSNLVYIKFPSESKNAVFFEKELREKCNILCDVRDSGTARMVTHRQISTDDVDYILVCAKKIMKN